MSELLRTLNSKTHEWLHNEALQLGFVAPGRDSAINFLFSEVGEALSEVENLGGTWARRQDVSVDQAQREAKLIKELCDVIMMACLAFGRDVVLNYEEMDSEESSYTDMAYHAGQSVMDSRFYNTHIILTLLHAVSLLRKMVPDVLVAYENALAERTRILKTKKRKKEASKRYTTFLDRANLTIERYREVERKQAQGLTLSEDEIVILHLWDELSKRHQEYVDMANKKTVIVPDGDCLDVIELFGQATDRSNQAELTLRQHGFSGNFPDDLHDWLVESIYCRENKM